MIKEEHDIADAERPVERAKQVQRLAKTLPSTYLPPPLHHLHVETSGYRE